MPRKPYASDVSDDEWALAAPYLARNPDAVPPHNPALREVFNGLRWLVQTGGAWRFLPHDVPPWETIARQTRHWRAGDVFAALTHDLRLLVSAVSVRALSQRPQRVGAEVTAGDRPEQQADAALGWLLTRGSHPATEQDRARAAALAAQVLAQTGEQVAVPFAEGATGDQPPSEATTLRLRLEVVPLPGATRGVAPGAAAVDARAQRRRVSAPPAVDAGLRTAAGADAAPASSDLGHDAAPARRGRHER